MKVTDDYKAKFRLWAEKPVVVPLPEFQKLPAFESRKFRSHEEMNRWKESLFKQLASSVPA